MAIDGKGLPWGSFDPMAGTIRDDGAWSLLLPRQECIGPMVRYSQGTLSDRERRLDGYR